MDNFNLPEEKLHTLIKELTPLLNRLNIDNELDTQDFLLAEMITEQINSMVVARRKSKKLSGKDEESVKLHTNEYKEHINYEIKKSLRATYKEKFTKEIEDIHDSLFESIILSDLNADQASKLIGFVQYKFSAKTYPANINYLFKFVLSEASNYCENFSYNEREQVQGKIRELYNELNWRTL